jgi:hypothetical protein
MIFIVGVGRSGTSLLQSMLNAHPNITSTPETHFLRNYVFPNLKNKGIVNAKNFFLRLEEDDNFKRISLPVDEIWTNRTSKKIDVLSFYKSMFKTYADYKGKQYLVDKDPRNIDYMPQLKHLFPKSKIIHIYRDPRDVVTSKTKAAWSMSRPYWLHALIGQYQMKIGRRNGQKCFSRNSQYIEVKYENLLEYPEQTLKIVTKFIGVEYNESMLSFSKSAKELVDKKEMQWKKETLKPLMKSNSNKWKTHLSTFQASFVEQVSIEYFQKLNYEKQATQTLSFSKRILLHFLSTLNLILPILYKLAMLRK